MLANWFLAAALFGSMMASDKAATPAGSMAAPVRVVVRGELLLIDPLATAAPDADAIQGCLPPPDWVVDADGQRFRLVLGRFHGRAVELVGRQVVVRGTLALDTVTVDGIEEPRDDALIRYARIAIEGELEREVVGVIPRRGEPSEEVVWRVRVGNNVHVLAFADRKVEAEALKLVGKKVVLTGTLREGVVHVATVARPLDLEDLLPWCTEATQDGNAAEATTQVVLFSSGVGYFTRDGDGRVDFTVPVQDVNALIQALAHCERSSTRSSGR